MIAPAALAAACLYALWGGLVGVAVPALTTVSSVYYGGDAFSGTRKFQAIVDIVARREIKLGYEKDKIEEDRAFSAEIRRLAP